MKENYIALNRQMLQWGWYDDPITKSVFIDILLNVKYKPCEFHGVQLKAGQGIFGRKAMSKRLGISEQSIRTALEHLKSTNEITTKSTNKFTIITVENWGKYQGYTSETNHQINQQPNQRLTNNQPTTNHIEERKKVNIENNYYSSMEDVKESILNGTSVLDYMMSD